MKKETTAELKRLENFIEEINLETYRKKYKDIKTVEMDMPKNVQALSLFYKVYWNEKRFLSFDEFWEEYKKTLSQEIIDFKNKYCYFVIEEWFWRGLEARIYRTWASLITQLHLTYLISTFDYVEGVDSSTILDHSGRDILIKMNNEEFGLQLKKVTNRKDSGIKAKVDTARKQEINVMYFVPTENDIKNPYYLKGEDKNKLKPQMANFFKYDETNGYLKRMNNGFVLFVENVSKLIKEELEKNAKK